MALWDLGYMFRNLPSLDYWRMSCTSYKKNIISILMILIILDKTCSFLMLWQCGFGSSPLLGSVVVVAHKRVLNETSQGRSHTQMRGCSVLSKNEVYFVQLQKQTWIFRPQILCGHSIYVYEPSHYKLKRSLIAVILFVSLMEVILNNINLNLRGSLICDPG